MAAVCAGLSACAGQPEEQTGRAAAGSATNTADEAVAWMDRFCGAVNSFVDGSNALTSATDGSTVAEIRRETVKQLDEYATLLGTAVEDLRDLPDAPVAAAGAAQKSYLDTYTTAHRLTVKAKKNLEAAADDDLAAQEAGVDALVAAQDKALGAIDPVGAVESSAELIEAAASAPRCEG